MLLSLRLIRAQRRSMLLLNMASLGVCLVIGFGIELIYSKQSILVESMLKEKNPYISLKQRKLSSSGCVLVEMVTLASAVLSCFAKHWN